MTVSAETIPYLARSVEYIESLGFYCMATFASGIHWELDNIKELLMEQLNKLVDYYSNNIDIIPCQMLNYNLKMIFYPVNDDFRYCGAGVVKKCYDIYGNCYPCQGLSYMTLGENSKNFLNKDFKEFQLSDENPCKACRWIRLCRTCYAANYMETGNIEHNSRDVCFINRACILASSKIKYKRLIKKDNFSDDDRLTLQAINIIQREIMEQKF